MTYHEKGLETPRSVAKPVEPSPDHSQPKNNLNAFSRQVRAERRVLQLDFFFENTARTIRLLHALECFADLGDAAGLAHCRRQFIVVARECAKMAGELADLFAEEAES